MLLGSFQGVVDVRWFNYDAEELHAWHSKSILNIRQGREPIFDPRVYWATSGDDERSGMQPGSETLVQSTADASSLLRTLSDEPDIEDA